MCTGCDNRRKVSARWKIRRRHQYVPAITVSAVWHVLWQDMLVLATLGDEAVVTWALSHLEDPLLAESEAASTLKALKLRWLPYHVLGRSPFPSAKAVADRLLAGGGVRARWIRKSRRESGAYIEKPSR